MQQNPVVGVVDECPATALGVASWLGSIPEIDVQVAEGAELFAQHGRTGPEADVVVMELMYRDRPRLADIGRLAGDGRQVVVYSRVCADWMAAEAVRSGAACCVSVVHEGRDALVGAARSLVAGPSRPAAVSPEPSPVRPRLSARERDAMVLWLTSSSKQAVAHRMRLSPHTVEMYLRRVRGKYQDVGRAAPTKADLLARAVEDGLIVLDSGARAARSVT